MASVHSIDCICERCVRLRQSETSKVTNDRIPAIVSHMREWLEVTESKPLMLFVLDREAVRQFVARFSDEPTAERWKERAGEAEGILSHNMALANATTRRAMNERNDIIRKLRERHSAAEIADMVGLTRQRIHQILNESPDEGAVVPAPKVLRQWTSYCNPQWHYGEICFQGKNWRVHRLVWTIMRGDIPEGHVLCHRCDNPPCCNPEHLFVGTDADNVLDRMAKGRDHHSQLTECPHGHPYSGPNLMVDSRGFRHCRTCTEARQKSPEYVASRREYQRKRRAERREQAKLLGQSRTGAEP